MHLPQAKSNSTILPAFIWEIWTPDPDDQFDNLPMMNSIAWPLGNNVPNRGKLCFTGLYVMVNSSIFSRIIIFEMLTKMC